MTRTVPEWIGKTPDARVPARVRLRVFEAHGGRCHISGRKIMAGEPWDLDHVVALVNGGEHRESNLAPALRDKHRAKTAADVAEKAAVYAKRAAHVGAKTDPRPKMKGRGFPKHPRQRPASAPLNKTLPPRRLGQ
jgi:5-methylcytosine-specific restriction enzyme A